MRIRHRHRLPQAGGSAAIYENLTRTAIHTVKPDNIATFLGRKLNAQYEGEMGNRFNIRIEGTRIKHTMGPVSLKLYDKFGLILRIETTVNDLTFFKHYREVEHRDGTKGNQMGVRCRRPSTACPHCANCWKPPIAAIWSSSPPSTIRAPAATSSTSCRGPSSRKAARYPGFNLFDPDDDTLFRAIVRGEFNISGLQNKTLRRHLPDKNSGQVSRLLKRLRIHGLIKKVGRTYKYY